MGFRPSLLLIFSLTVPFLMGEDGRFWLARPGDSYARIAARLQVSTQDVLALNGGKPVLQGAPIRLPEISQVTARKGDTWEVLSAALGVPIAALKGANPSLLEPVAGRPIILPTLALPGAVVALQWPVTGKIRNGFGPVDAIAQYGMTFTLNRRSVQAAAPGTVTFQGALRGLGHTLMVSHPGRLITLYAGLDNSGKKVGDTVKRGEALGQVEGEFFFSIFQEGMPQDPQRLLKGNP